MELSVKIEGWKEHVHESRESVEDRNVIIIVLVNFMDKWGQQLEIMIRRLTSFMPWM